MCGPQDSGVILGKKEWIERCIKFGAPEHGICRVSKTSREAMAGLYTAIENYVNQDEIERNQELRFLLHIISEKLKDGKMKMKERIVERGPVGQTYPRLFLYLPEEIRADEIVYKMKERRIYIGADEFQNAIYVSPLNLNEEEAQIVAKELLDILTE